MDGRGTHESSLWDDLLPAGRGGRSRRRYHRDARTLVQGATAELRRRILSGELAPGSSIRLDETARLLEMSPIPLREALRTLATEGLVENFPQRGYRVRAASREDLEDTYRLRMLLEPSAVRSAVERLTEADLRELRDAFSDHARIGEEAEWEDRQERHARFHFALYRPCGSPWLLRIISMLWANSGRYQNMSTVDVGSRQPRVDEHRNILLAYEKRSVEDAARLMQEHLEHTYRVATKYLESQQAT